MRKYAEIMRSKIKFSRQRGLCVSKYQLLGYSQVDTSFYYFARLFLHFFYFVEIKLEIVFGISTQVVHNMLILFEK